MTAIEDSIVEKVRIPLPNDKVYKSECGFSFHDTESPNGLYICLNRFLAFSQQYVGWYSQKTGNKIFLNIKTIRHEIELDANDEPLTKKATKLAIGVEGGFTEAKKYTTEEILNICVFPELSPIPLSDASLPQIVKKSVSAIMASDSVVRQMEVDALQNTWDGEKRLISKYADNLVQLDNGKKIPPTGWKCEKCDLKDNLWLNLTDGAILCGRKFFDGTGGNNHAMEYYSALGYPLAVKLGTITPTSADVYSYAEDDMVEDPQLAQHLAHFGIDVMKLEKTEKTMIELELDLNQRSWEWSTMQESGSQLTLVYGPNCTGLFNLGNTCYMNSVFQMLFSTAPFLNYYCRTPMQIFENAPNDPNLDFNTQMRKLAHGLTSGEFSKEPTDAKCLTRNGIRPNLIKNLIGRGHFEFATNKQQDSAEYLQHLFTFIERNSVGQVTPTEAFKFEVEDRLECNSSRRVKYHSRVENLLSLPVPVDRAVNKEDVIAYQARKTESEKSAIKLDPSEAIIPQLTFDICMQSFLSPSVVEDFYSSAIKSKTTATKSVKLRSFPDCLLIQLQKFDIGVNWVEHKLDASVDMPLEIDLSCLKGFGLQANESLLPDDQNTSEPEPMEIDSKMLSSLVSMGFQLEGCQRALMHTKGQDLESAVNWIMEHMGDEDFGAPLPNLSKRVDVDKESLDSIVSMGFSRKHATEALQATDNSLDRAIDWIFSHPEMNDEIAIESINPTNKLTDGSTRYQLTAFISHMGPSSKYGHYVCHVKRGEGWVIYNDEKVAQSLNPPRNLSYIYLYTRI